MLGCRNLTPKEVELITNALSTRNRAIFILGLRTGFRINELLSLNVEDAITEHGSVRDSIRVRRCNTKGKGASQAVPLHHEAREAIERLVIAHPALPHEPLFRSTGTGGRQPGRLEYTVYRKALKKAAKACGIDATRICTHSQRKVFAANMLRTLGGDPFKLRIAMRHRSLQSTMAYIDVDEQAVMAAIKKAR